ncbi:hypothetical protein [Nitriliruptor alkaliphilus]|uniref:hypothetical protein n=1 Tax=Nitriliruptor alkaliphilus TaxID=427918 RepID=UPI0012EDB1D4|nr:hypothetical protein [Nitriliruptor alkaliphilus]
MSGAAEPIDPLDALRTELEETVDDRPVADRVSRFEHANDVLARELALLDEV